jgi:hypothetical protein
MTVGHGTAMRSSFRDYNQYASKVASTKGAHVDFQPLSDDMGIMTGQSSSLELVQAAIEAHLAPNVHLPSLPRALELLAHIALVADKLQQEITRILESNARNDPEDEHNQLGEKTVRKIEKYSMEAGKASRRLWQVSVQLRLNVSCDDSHPGRGWN